jgi:hypothetical protein
VEWKRLHNEELYNLYSPNIIPVIKSRRIRWAEHVARKGDRRCVYRILVGKPYGKRSLGRPMRRWEDNIKNNSSRSGVGAWVGLIWLRIGIIDGHLWMR